MSTATSLTPPHASADWRAVKLAHAFLRLTRLGVLGTWNYGRRTWARRHGAHVFHVTSTDGVRLQGLRLPARGPHAGQGLPVVLAHGYVETKERHLSRAVRLAQTGHEVILFDQRGHGRSGGDLTTFGVREREDVKVVIDYAQQAGWIRDRVVTMGYSLGAATVLQHAATDARVAGVVAFAPFADMCEAVRSYRRLYAPWTNEAWLLAGFAQAARESGFEMEAAATLPAVRTIQCPVLLVIGLRDSNLPKAQHAGILANAMAAGRCRMFEVPQADHVTICRRPWPGLDEAVATFLRQVQNAGSGAGHG